MRTLNGADRYQLYIESPTHHQHTLKVLVLSRRELRRPLTLERVRQWAGEVLPACPPLRWQVAALPGGRPVWVDRPHLDLDHHVQAATVAAPGGREELGALLGRLDAIKLDRTRPLWRLWLVDGLADDQVALVWSLHHALADGLGTVAILEDIFDDGPDGRSTASAPSPPHEELPGTAALLGIGIRGVAERTAHLPALLGRSLRSVRVVRSWRRAGVVGPARPFRAPMTPFGHTISANRVCATASVSLDDVQDVRRVTGCTVNDVFVAVASGALRAYLDQRGLGAARSLTAGMPVSIRTPDQAGDYGNLISTWFFRLATDEPDPLTRLRAVHDALRSTRALAEARRSQRLQLDWMEHTLAFKAYVGFGNLTTRRAGRPPFNVILSSVRGPHRLWFDGAPVTEIQSYSQLAAGIGLNMTAWSYDGRVTVGLVACPEHVDDLWALADQVGPALDELRSHALEGRAHDQDVAV
jgi:WS/DGAT/MGAT family acyltransferase